MLRALPLAMIMACEPANDGELFRLSERPVPDFSLTDDNPASATYAQQVSPRDGLGHATAWYFGHST